MIDRSLTPTPATFQPSPSFLQCHVILHALPIEPLTSPPVANFLMSPCCFPLPHPYPCAIPFTRSDDAILMSPKKVGMQGSQPSYRSDLQDEVEGEMTTDREMY